MQKHIYIAIFILPGMLAISGFFANQAKGQNFGDPLVRYYGEYAYLTVGQISEQTFEISLAPVASITANEPVPFPKSNHTGNYSKKILFEGRSVMDPFSIKTGNLVIDILRSPLRVIFKNPDEEAIQELRWPEGDEQGRVEFNTGDSVFEKSEENGNTPQIVVSSSGWALFFDDPPGKNHKFTFTNGKGIFTPAPGLQALRLFLIFFEDTDGLVQEYSLLTGKEMLPGVWQEK